MQGKRKRTRHASFSSILFNFPTPLNPRLSLSLSFSSVSFAPPYSPVLVLLPVLHQSFLFLPFLPSILFFLAAADPSVLFSPRTKVPFWILLCFSCVQIHIAIKSQLQGLRFLVDGSSLQGLRLHAW